MPHSHSLFISMAAALLSGELFPLCKNVFLTGASNQNGSLECDSGDKYTAKKEEKVYDRRQRQRGGVGSEERQDCHRACLWQASECQPLLWSLSSLSRSSVPGSLVLYSEFPDEVQCCGLYFLFFFFPYFT